MRTDDVAASTSRSRGCLIACRSIRWNTQRAKGNSVPQITASRDHPATSPTRPTRSAQAIPPVIDPNDMAKVATTHPHGIRQVSAMRPSLCSTDGGVVMAFGTCSGRPRAASSGNRSWVRRAGRSGKGMCRPYVLGGRPSRCPENAPGRVEADSSLRRDAIAPRSRPTERASKRGPTRSAPRSRSRGPFHGCRESGSPADAQRVPTVMLISAAEAQGLPFTSERIRTRA